MIKIYMIFIFFTIFQGQIKNYDVVIENEILGSFSVNKTVSNDSIIITSKAIMTFTYLFMNHDFNQNSIWKIADNFFSYSMNSTVSANETQVTIKKINSKYHFKRDSFFSSDDFIISSKPENLFIMLYFKEPIIVDDIFSSNFGKSYKLKQLSSHQYFYKTDKNEWILFYNEKGHLIKAKFKGFIEYELIYNPKGD